MQIDRERFLLLAGALSACQAAAAPSPPVQTAVAPAAPAGTASACAPLLAQNRQILAQPTGACADRPATEVAWARAQLAKLSESGSPFGQCHSGHGTWVAVALSATLSEPSGESGPSCGAEVSYSLVFVSAAGAKSTSKPRTWTAFADEQRTSAFAGQFDYDGDGNDELIVDDTDAQNGAGTVSSLEVLRASGATVERYKVGFHIDQTVDADGDGRPDFVTDTFFSAEDGCTPTRGKAPDILGVPLLVHSLANGTFSMSDEVARRWARRECPSDPGNGAAKSADPASCGRIWGHSVDALTKGLPKGDTCPWAVNNVRSLLKTPLPFAPLTAQVSALPGKAWPRTEGVAYEEPKDK